MPEMTARHGRPNCRRRRLGLPSRHPLPDQRVKLYCLTDDGNWDDQETGHGTIDKIEGSKEFALAVVDEKDNDTLLLHKITSDDIYKKQETIILWKDPEKALELALSFQEAEGCAYIWKNILYVQKKLESGSPGCGFAKSTVYFISSLLVSSSNIFPSLASQVIPYPTFETPESEVSSGSDESSAPDELNYLPPVELSSLPLLLKTVLEWEAKDALRVSNLISQDHEFSPKLVGLFKMCEGSRKMDDLHIIFRLVKGIISLNNSKIFNKIFSDEFILDIIGALEYCGESENEAKC